MGPSEVIMTATVSPVVIGKAPPPSWLQATQMVIIVKSRVPKNSAKRAAKTLRDTLKRNFFVLTGIMELAGNVKKVSSEKRRYRDLSLGKFMLFIDIRFIHEHASLSVFALSTVGPTSQGYDYQEM